MELYSFFNSSTSFRVRIALALKGLSSEYHPVNIREGEQKSVAHKALSPIGGIPIIRDGELTLTQSLAIIDYLDEVQPDVQLIPKEQPKRAKVLEFSYLIACDIHPINNLRVLGFLQKEFGINQDQKNTWYAHWVSEGLAAAEDLLSRVEPSTFCFGNQPTLADCCLIPQVSNAHRMGCDLTPYKRVMRIYEHCLQLSAFKQASPENQSDFIK